MGKLPSTVLRRPGTCLAHAYTDVSPSAAAARHHRPAGLLSSMTPSSFQSSTGGATTTQVRHATYVMRSRRPYEFTQLVQLSDGSTFTMRTTSPTSYYRSTKDTRNTVLWQPSDKSLRNVEQDEAGKLAAFRERFGRGWDLDSKPEDGASEEVSGADTKATAASKGGKAAAAPEPVTAKEEEPAKDPFDSLADLISGYAANDGTKAASGMSAKEYAKKQAASKKKK